uniref:Deacetylase sirtuin-type domain-containing protein n=1 Tax=Arcella intermedia TaxID=1963864 RepID=A0A6B2L6P9_9EUKA
MKDIDKKIEGKLKQKDSKPDNPASDSEDSVSFDLTPELSKDLLEECKKTNRDPTEILVLLGFPDVAAMLNCMDKEDLYPVLESILLDPNPVAVLMSLEKQMSSLKNHRKKLESISTEEDVMKALQKANNIIVITGAGTSVSCGIPDFRSPGGLYDQINEKFNLQDPHLLFDINYLKTNPSPFFEFAKQLFPSADLKPSFSHYFIKELENKKKLLRHYTQNIDMLEQVCGITSSVQCHGSFEKAKCITCPSTMTGNELRTIIHNEGIPYCKNCSDGKSFYKPSIVFFGEALPDEFFQKIEEDCNKCDLLLVIGSSLQVEPVAHIPHFINEINPETPQILINNEIVGGAHEWDYFFEGPCDDSIKSLSQKLSWNFFATPNQKT